MYAGGLRYLDGQKVFTDFLGYTPGRYLVVESVYRLFGFDMINVRYIFAVITALFGVFAFQISRRLMPAPYALVATLLVISAPAVYYQRFYGLSILFNAWAVLVFLENRRNAIWVVIALVFAYLFKHEVVLLMVPVYGLLLYRFLLSKGVSMRRIVATTVFVSLALFIYLFASLPDKDGIKRISSFYSQEGNSFPVLWEGYQGAEFGLFPFFENLLFYLPFFTGLYLLYIAFRRETGDKRNTLLVLAHLQLAALCLALFRAGFDNLIRCLPLFFIVATYLVYRMMTGISASWLKKAVGAGMALLLLIYLVDFNVMNGFYTGSIGAIRDNDKKIESGRAAGIYAENMDVALIRKVTHVIKRESSPGDPILALPLNPIWYYLSGRKNPTRFDFIMPGTLVSREQEEQMVSQLESDPPVLMILVDLEIDNKPERRLAVYAPLIVQWIADNYRYNGEIAYFQLWGKKR